MLQYITICSYMQHYFKKFGYPPKKLITMCNLQDFRPKATSDK
jgi:hypothetical protein